MKYLLLIFLYFPIISASQVFISTSFINRADANKKFSSSNLCENISISSFINDNLAIGFSNEKSVADYIYDGLNPVQDSLVIADYKFFLNYYLKNNIFIFYSIPFKKMNEDLNLLERHRFGAGFNIVMSKYSSCELNYNLLVNSNKNGFRKGKLSISYKYNLAGVQKLNFNSEILLTKLFKKIIVWLNTPLNKGYKSDMFFVKKGIN